MVKFGEKKNIKGNIIWCKQKTNKQTAKKKKYLVFGHLEKVIRPLVFILPKMSAYVQRFKRFNLGGGRILLPYWFSLNDSETVKAVTLAFCRI